MDQIRNSKYIVFGGIKQEGLMRRVLEQCGALCENQVITREPGGTVLSEHIRTSLQGDLTEVNTAVVRHLISAARIDHEMKVVLPALHRGEHVFCDSTDYTDLHRYDINVSEPSLLHAGFTREQLGWKPTMLVLFLSKNPQQEKLNTIIRNLEGDVNIGLFPWRTDIVYFDPGTYLDLYHDDKDKALPALVKAVTARVAEHLQDELFVVRQENK